MHYRRLTAKEVESAKALLADGLTKKAVAERFGVAVAAIERIANPEVAERRRLRDVARAAAARAASAPTGIRNSREDNRDAEARLAEVPEDTRTELQRLMGEPTLQRSALWRKRQGLPP